MSTVYANDAPSHGTGPQYSYFDTAQAADYLKSSTRTLERFRRIGGGPKYAKTGRKVLYRRDWLDAWVESRSFASTSDAKQHGVW